MISESDAYRVVCEEEASKRTGGIEKGCGVEGVWVASSRVQVLVFWSLNRQAAGLRSQNQLSSNTLTHQSSEAPQLNDSNNSTLCLCVNEALRLIYKTDNGARHCACVQSVLERGCVSVGVREPKGGNWPTFSPLFCISPQCLNRKKWSSCELDAAMANTQGQIWGVGGVNASAGGG